MKLNHLGLAGYLIFACLLSSCSFVSQQLADKRMEEQLLRPGALDSDVATNFDEYRFQFLDKYRVSHAWPVTSTCKYAGLRTRYKMGDTSYGDVYSIKDIYEEGNSTKQRDADPKWNFDRYVRSVKVQRPDYDKEGKVVGYHEAQEGLQAICFEAWIGTDHSLTARLVKLPLNERVAFYSEREGLHSIEKIGTNTWHVWQYAIDPNMPNRYGGEVWVTAVGDTDYTLTFLLGAGVDSVKFPQAHAAFQTMFKHLIESVRIEPLTPAISAEMEQLKAQAFEISRQECVRMNQTMRKPPAWCQKYLNP